MWTGIAMAVAAEAGNQKRLRRLTGKSTPNKSRFGEDDFPQNRASRLKLQCKFFGFKPKRFISVYAKKPRILVKVKSETIKLTNIMSAQSRLDYSNQLQLTTLYNQQRQMGIQNSSIAYQQQMMDNQHRAQHYALANAVRQSADQSQFGFACGGLGLNYLLGAGQS